MEIRVAPINLAPPAAQRNRISWLRKIAPQCRLSLGLVTALLVLAAGQAGAADPSAGQTLFASHCARCHGDDGRGKGTIMRLMAAVRIAPQPADFTDAAAMKSWTDPQLETIISQGGKATGRSSVMPAYGDKLTATDIADLVAYIRSMQK